MQVIKTWFGSIELQNGKIVNSNVVTADVAAIVLRLQEEAFADFEKKCRGRLREMALQLNLVASERDYVSLVRAVSIQQAKQQIASAFSRPDARIIQLIDGIDDIDESINLLSERLLEWDILTFEVYRSEDSENRSLPPTGSIPVQIELTELVERLGELRKRISRAVEIEMQTTAPNLSSLAGELLGARLIARAGGLEPLARMPASKIQVMGASKALFKHVQFGAKPPKHGLIFQHPLIRGSPARSRGKMARTLAAKLAIAARLDFYSKVPHPELSTQIEKRAKDLDTRVTRE
jgi:nucleolar protein 56